MSQIDVIKLCSFGERPKKHTVRIFGYSPTDIALDFKFDKDLIQEIRGFEGADFDRNLRVWHVRSPALSERNAFLFILLQGKKTVYDYPTPSIGTTNFPLYEFQKEPVAMILQRRRVFICGEMGVGKTRMPLEAHSRLDLKYPTWVVCPKGAIRAWHAEFFKLRYLNRYIDVFNYEQLENRMRDTLYPPQMLILDESHFIKNPGAKRSQLCYQLQELMAQHYKGKEYVICMTGTPAPNDPSDWWHQCEVARPGFLREKNANECRHRIAYYEADYLKNQEPLPLWGKDKEETEKIYASARESPYPKVLGYKKSEVELFHRRIQGLAWVKFKKDCLDLPDKVYEEIQTEISEDTLSVARTLADTCANSLELASKLSQLSDGFLYDKNHKAEYGDCPKDTAIEEYLDLCAERGRVVIYAAFQASVDKLVKLALDKDWAVIKADGRGWVAHGPPDLTADPTSFQSPTPYPIAFIGNPGVAGIGITLTAAECCIFYSNSLDPKHRLQAEDRIHRIGMTKATIIDVLHLPSDKKILDTLKRKKEIQSVSMGELRSCLYAKVQN